MGYRAVARAGGVFHDYGNYDLTVVVPSGYITGGNGVRIDEQEQGDGTRRAPTRRSA